MSSLPLLHEHKDFKSLIEILSKEMSLQPQLVEKDYWIMHCLYGLALCGFKMELKGGTSLSKGFQVIERFSEDIDIKIDPPSNLSVMAGPNHDKPIHIESRRSFFDWLTNNIKIPGIRTVERDASFDDSRMRNAGIRLVYDSHFNPLPKLKMGILLEVGFDRTIPNEKITISSWAYDWAAKSKVEVKDNRAVDVPCFLPQYTLVEKLQAISTKFRQQQEKGKSFPPNFLRHYYDVYKLLALPIAQSFVGTPEYHEYKKKRFRGGDNLDITTNEAFLLTDPVTSALYESEYNKSADLYFKGQVPWNDIISSIRANAPKL